MTAVNLTKTPEQQSDLEYWRQQGQALRESLDPTARRRLERLAEIVDGIRADTYCRDDHPDDADMRRAAQMAGLRVVAELVCTEFGLCFDERDGAGS